MRRHRRAVSQRKNNPSRSHSASGRRDQPQGQRDRRQFGGRQLAGGPQAQYERRGQCGHRRLSGRGMDLYRRAGLGGADPRSRLCARGSRRRRGGGGAGHGQGPGRHPHDPRPGRQGHPLRHFHQQDGRRRGPCEGKLRGAAKPNRTAVGPAGNSDPQRRGNHRLCRSGEPAGLCLQGRRAVGFDRAAGRPVRPHRRRTHGPVGIARRL